MTPLGRVKMQKKLMVHGYLKSSQRSWKSPYAEYKRRCSAVQSQAISGVAPSPPIREISIIPCPQKTRLTHQNSSCGMKYISLVWTNISWKLWHWILFEWSSVFTLSLQLSVCTHFFEALWLYCRISVTFYIEIAECWVCCHFFVALWLSGADSSAG